MKLLNQNLNDPLLKEKHYTLPNYDREAVLAQTRQKPVWVHMGAGNIARSFLSQVAQDSLDSGSITTGMIICEGFDYEIIEKAYRPFDNLCINVILNADGSVKKNVVASMTESLVMDPQREDWTRLRELFTLPSLQMVSFTITEKGYNLKDLKGNYMPAVLDDFAAGIAAPKTYMGKIAALCYARYQAGALPLALVSMDNCSHNGKRLEDAVCDFARHWVENEIVDAGFLTYITGNEKIAFPWTAIDKITPRPDPTVHSLLTADGLDDMTPVETSRHTFVAPFVNAEQTQYLVIEDHFPNGRPNLKAQGVYFTGRATVEKFEQMKVCTCLNPLHTALAVLGCMLGYNRISDEMKDEDLAELIHRIAFRESMPVVVDPGIIDPVDFASQVIEQRLPNPFIPDTPQRIATDTSQKLAIRFGNTIRAYLADEKMDVQSLRYIPFVLAAWCRYLLAIDDSGTPFTPSADPMLAELQTYVAGIELGSKGPFHDALQPILSNVAIFGVDLYGVGLGERVEQMFAELVAGPGSILTALHTLLAD